MPQIAIIDLEASGLRSVSYPTEIGWATIREDGCVNSGACLIRPPPKWTTYANAWSPASERLTGITKEMLDRDGQSPREAMARLIEAVGDRDLFSDGGKFDAHWLGMLVDAAGVCLGGRKLDAVQGLIKRMGWTVKFADPPPHRAEADARRLALAIAQAIKAV